MAKVRLDALSDFMSRQCVKCPRPLPRDGVGREPRRKVALRRAQLAAELRAAEQSPQQRADACDVARVSRHGGGGRQLHVVAVRVENGWHCACTSQHVGVGWGTNGAGFSAAAPPWLHQVTRRVLGRNAL